MEPPQLVLAGGWRTMAKARIACPLAYRSRIALRIIDR